MVRKYQKTDYKEVESWFHKRNIPITEDYLPEHGFIAPGIAAGYLYATDANFCLFECFISDPSVAKSECHKALREIVTCLIQEAKELGFKDAFGFATSKTMIEIGYEQDFKFVEKCTTIQRVL